MGPQNPNNQNPNQATNSSPVTVSSQPSGPNLPSDKKDFSFARFSNMWLIGFIAVVAIGVLVIIAVITIALIKQPKKNTGGPKVSNALCFVRTAHLDCVNAEGVNLVRYNIKVPAGNLSLTNLVPSNDRSEYLGWSADDPSPNDIWILNKNLNTASIELSLPAGLTASDPSWTNDGQSILMTEENPQNSQQIYIYSPTSHNNQQLTNLSQNTTTPYQTENGKILFGVSNGNNTWMPYIMNSDGTSINKLGNLSGLAVVRGFAYSAQDDMVFVYGNNSKDKPTLVYGSVAEFINNGNVKTVNINVANGDSIGLLNATTIVVGHNSIGTIINLTNPANSITISHYGSLVGVLNISLFQRSSQQTEQPFERIANLSSAPSGFVSYVEPLFTAQDAKCMANKSAQANGEEYTMSITNIVSDQYAVVDQGCGQATTTYYALNNAGNWSVAYSGNVTPTCSLINGYGFPTSIFPQCINPVGRLVGNNPQTDLQVN